MKEVKVILTDDQAEKIEQHHRAELSDEPAGSRSKAEAAREQVAQKFEAEGYSTQAEEMRNGELDVSQYVENLETGPGLAEKVGDVLAENVPDLSLN